jgi:hypothetical protein
VVAEGCTVNIIKGCFGRRWITEKSLLHEIIFQKHIRIVLIKRVKGIIEGLYW